MEQTFILPKEIREDVALPKYHQIYSQLKKELFFGRYAAGARFFSIRDLRERYRVNAETIRAAIDRLVEDGFVTSKPMSGLYVNEPEKHRPDIAMGNIWFCQLTGGRSYPFYSGMLAALQRQAAQMGLSVIVNHGSDVSDLKRWFRPETGDGLVVTGNIDDDIVCWLQNDPSLRYAIVGNYALPPDTPNIRYRVADATYKAMKVCAQAGRRKIATILNPDAKIATREIMTGVNQAINEGLIEHVGEVLDAEEDGYEGMLKLRDSGCDGAFVSEAAFFGLCRYVFERRVKCPEELFVVRYGKNEERDHYGDVAAVNMTSDRARLAKAVLGTLFGDGPALVEMDIAVTASPIATKKTNERRKAQ